jgi:SAM-dependent methyltransferase
LGTSGPNPLTDSIQAHQKDFYDLTLGNWEINSNWNIPQQKYDLVVCTRCPYFAEDPTLFIKKCLAITKRGGLVFADWGLGDHWRHEQFKVGWIRGGEHERVQYGQHISKLYSCYWDDVLENDPNVKAFRQNIIRFGYDQNLTMGDIIRYEVPAILRPSSIGPAKVNTLFLWPDAPQLYISTLYVKDHV